ncbi:Mce related protein [Mycobacteroides abscessus subsp. bolletii]|uniref:MlaD family protein n=1 Tax=Mycobacteroides abscessus TaxID=36809 RepID=UPI0009A672E9|nr:MlaD family protein [Mycobacteroides abscessus]SKG69082.1 Mce related protein [Mycobacteroides abscessus subsp. bolletii]SLF40433.1 Mce related protein [Mycobacteroides abscessus subsp. bolletii]
MIETIASAILRTVRACYRRHAALSGIALALTLVFASAYIGQSLPAASLTPTYQVTVHLSESGGLLPDQDVTFHGARVGRVESVKITPASVEALVDIDAKIKIPETSAVRVSGLSPAGEQYVNFTAANSMGPYLTDGSVIALGKAHTPVTLAQLLANADGVLAQVDPEKFELIRKELSLSSQGPQKLAAIVDGGTFLLSTLDSVLPQTMSLLKSSRVVLALIADKNAGITTTAANFHQVFAGVGKMQQGYQKLVANTPHLLGAADSLFEDNSDTMVQLLGNLTTVAQLSYVRTPALNALFPNYRGSLLDAVSSTMRDHGLWATADLYPRYTCDYGTPRGPGSDASYPEPPLYTYCRDDDPAVLVRGAKNAPRPAGDDTAGPPPGANLAATTDPTPKGRFTIPTPYGGPTLPIEPPR